MTYPDESSCTCACADHDAARRSLLTGALAMLGAACVPAMAETGRTTKPQPGDRLAFMMGEKKDQEIKPADLLVGAAPTLAYPLDPATGKVLESRVNLLTVLRLEPEAIADAVKPHAADGIVAYSAICTHYGCPITTLHPSQTKIVCNCHGSVFDAGNRGVVAQGPATRRLAMLPLGISDGALVITGKFDGPLGPPT